MIVVMEMLVKCKRHISVQKYKHKLSRYDKEREREKVSLERRKKA